MKNFLTILLLSTFLMGSAVSQKAVALTPANGKILPVYYPLGSARLNLSYQSNQASIDSILMILAQFKSGTAPSNLHKVEIVGTSSPLGPVDLNDRLSALRANSLKNYLKQQSGLPDSLFVMKAQGEDWTDLRRMVTASDMKYKQQVLDLMDRVPVNRGLDYQLMNLKWGIPYREMMDRFFPQLQKAAYVQIYTELKSETLPVEALMLEGAEVSAYPTDLAPVLEATQALNESRSENSYPKWNLSTNLLYWGALAPNVGLEYCMPNGRWSINGEFFSPWWKNNRKHKYDQIRHYSLEGRYWFRPDGNFTHHFVSGYVNMGLYDLENGGTGYKGEFAGAGLTYGYVWAIRPRFRIELSIGAGYLNTEYEEYEPIDTHYVYRKTVRANYWGPTKAKIGLVWTIATRQQRKGWKK